MIKISDKVRYPDFLIGKLCSECDGERWHKDKDDTKRDRELIAAGYEILHFKGKMINKNIQKVERCILHKLAIGEHHENSQEVLFYG